MKITFVLTVLLLACVASQARNVNESLLKDNRALIADIDKAKESLKTATTYAGFMGGQEMIVVSDLNEGNIYNQLFQLYRNLINFKINKTEVENLRNIFDFTIIDISTQNIHAMKETRNTIAAADLALYDLNILQFDSLNVHINMLETSQYYNWYGVTRIENQLKTFQQDINNRVTLTITKLSAAQKAEVNANLVAVESSIDIDIINLKNVRLRFVDASNNAVTALKLVLSQLPATGI